MKILEIKLIKITIWIQSQLYKKFTSFERYDFVSTTSGGRIKGIIINADYLTNSDNERTVIFFFKYEEYIKL